MIGRSRTSSTHSGYVLVATLILLLGAGLRLAELNHFPPGLHYDEAADMLLGRDIAFFGYNPFPVVTAYSGREALFYYLSVPLLHVFGAQIMATRVTSALLGIVTIAGTMALGKALFRGWRERSALALLAGAWLAVNGAQVWLTRQGFRTSPQPLLEALCVWLLVVGLNRSRRWHIPLLLAGVFGGLSLYVYMAARVFPLWLLLPLVFLIGIDGSRRGLRLRQALWFGAVLAVTALPIVGFYTAHPDVFLDRLAQLTPRTQSTTVSLVESLSLHAEMFFVRGDPTLRYNLYPGRPFFDPLSGVLLMVGWVCALWLALGRKRSPLMRFGGMLLALCPLLIAPSLIATAGLPPSHMRSVAMVPFIFFLPAWGLMTVGRWLKAVRVGGTSLRPLLAGGMILALGAHTWIDYRAWGARPDVFYQANGDYLLAARWLEVHAGADDLIYFASEYYEHPTVLAHHIDSRRLRWMMAEHLFFPPADRDALIIIPRALLDAHWRWGDQLPAEKRLPNMPLGADGEPAFAAYRISRGEATPIEPLKTSVNFGNILRWQGGQISTESAIPNALHVRLWWSVSSTPQRADLAPVLVVNDAWGNEITRFTPYLEQTARWLPGERLGFDLDLALPPGTPPGSYEVRIAWVSRTDPGFYVSRLNDQGAFAGLWAAVGDPVNFQPSVLAGVQVPAGATQIQPGLWVQIGNIPARLEQGDLLRFSLEWYAQNPPSDLGRVEIQAEKDDALISLWQGSPVGDTYPFQSWRAGEQVRDRYTIPLSTDMPPGVYSLSLKLNGGQLPLGQIAISPVERVLNAPPDLAPDPYDFGEQIRLVRWNFYRSAPDQVEITLIWQAQGTPEQDYTVFVHVVNPEGVILHQQDQAPARPTRRWVAGEYVSEIYRLQVPLEDAYSFRVGWYLQENGLRLPVKDFEGREIGDFAPFPALD